MVSDGPHKHASAGEMSRVLKSKFEVCANKVSLSADASGHFRAHCLKHDLEALLLAAAGELRQRLKTTDKLRDWWRQPVEDQNDNNPPKQIVKALFKKYTPREYIEDVDAPWILERAKLDIIESTCVCFGAFVRELRELTTGT
jgi:hypothetical protein